MIIPPPYAPVLATLSPGQFAIPELVWSTPTAPLVLPSVKLPLFQAMFTIVNARGFAHVTAAYLPKVAAAAGLVDTDINILESGILYDIERAIKGCNLKVPVSPTDAELTKIAVGIQLWGGITGRPPFVKGGGFLANFNVTNYRKIITRLLLLSSATTVASCPNLAAAVPLWIGPVFPHFGVSFATKHFSFWSRGIGMPTLLPIYDSIIAEKFMGYFSINKKTGRRTGAPLWKHYGLHRGSVLKSYVQQIHDEVAAINKSHPHLGGKFTVVDLERQLFNWANTPAAAGWIR